jgi:hypothetical protein
MKCEAVGETETEILASAVNSNEDTLVLALKNN